MKNNGGSVVERGHELAYLIWDTKSLEELDHLRSVFDSCMRIRKDQFRVISMIKERTGLRTEFVLLED